MAEEKLDLLDLDDEVDLPEADGGFAPARPKRPWLLFGAALIVIVLATYIIIRIVGGGHNDDSMEIDLTTPAPATEEVAPAPDFAASADNVIAGKTAESAPSAAPVRVVSERPKVEFKPDNKAQSTEHKAQPEPAAKPVAPKPAAKPQSAGVSNFYVQFGSYGTKSGAEGAQKRLQANHSSLFAGKQFVILAAVLPNGTTTYRLRVGFGNVNDANGFCHNAKSDGLDCYVAK